MGVKNLWLALWRTYSPNTNYGLLSSHAKAPILDLQWSLFSPLLYSVSADHTLLMTDVTTGQRTRKIRAHREIINSIDRTMASGSGTELLATGSDDSTVKIWEGGQDAGKVPVSTLEVGCPVTAVCWGSDGNTLYVGAIDNEVHVREILMPALDESFIPFCLMLGLRPPQRFANLFSHWSHRHAYVLVPFP